MSQPDSSGEPTSGMAGPAPRLLIVDDSPDNRNMLARRFQRRGYEVIEADGGRAALDLIAAEPIDLVLLDVRMPDMDGRQVLQKIRAERSPVELPVIMVTGNAASEDVVEALSLGANDYITKPIDIAVALARAETQIGRKRAEEAVRKANAELEQRIAERTADLEAANRELRLASEAAQAANRAKDQFLTNMSHELRTPLNGVLGMAQALGAAGLSPDQREMVAVIERSAGALQTVLSDLLDIVDLDAGEMEMTPQISALGEIVRAAVETAAVQANVKGLGFVLEMDPAAEGQVEVDPARLRQVLSKVLSNAVKFTDAGTVRLYVHRPIAAPDKVIFEATDTGVGFDPADAERLFQRFEQADGSMTRRFDGVGLGLSICSQVVRLMGGTISADSSPGQGSTFTIVLPLPPIDASVAHEPAAPAPDRPMTVLCAEDHPVNRQVLEYVLTAAGLDMVAVENGADAVEAYKSRVFDAVLMDMQMPTMDGLTATREIRRIEKELGRAPTPIIMLTAHGLPEHRRASQAAGADRHITKPIVTTNLLTVLAELALSAQERGAA